MIDLPGYLANQVLRGQALLGKEVASPWSARRMRKNPGEGRQENLDLLAIDEQTSVSLRTLLTLRSVGSIS